MENGIINFQNLQISIGTTLNIQPDTFTILISVGDHSFKEILYSPNRTDWVSKKSSCYVPKINLQM